MPRLFAQPSFDRVERQSMVDWFFFKLERRIREIFEVLILLTLSKSNSSWTGKSSCFCSTNY